MAFTHLHWDHAGSLVQPGALDLFARARFCAHELEWADALSGNELLYKSYPAPVVQALQAIPAARRLAVTDAQPEVAPGVRLARSSGHTRGHAALVVDEPEVRIGDAWRRFPRAVFAGDVCPTRHHLRMVFQTSYDTFPLDTRAWKRAMLPQLAAERSLLLFDHDPDCFAAVIAEDEREEFAAVESFNLALGP